MPTQTKLKKALFEYGHEVEYIGDRQIFADADGKQPLLIKGLSFLIIETETPYIGKGFIANDHDGEPLIDHDKDGYNVYINSRGERRIIWPKDKAEWRVLK